MNHAPLVSEETSPFKDPIQQFQYYDKYARWLPDLKRREVWSETVQRSINFLKKNTKTDFTEAEWDEMQAAIFNLEVMPSMRVIQMAGPALERDNTGVYNCAYLAIDTLDAFSDLLYILMQGTGVGYSVEDRYVSRLPRIKKQKRGASVQVYVVADSTEGWCAALKKGLHAWFSGHDIEFDLSRVREAGAILRTKGGRASGSQPLKELLTFARDTILAAQGKKLTTLNCHDIACYCGFIVQVGGVRRAAEISLSDIEDHDIAECKNGEFWKRFPYRSMANNSAVFEEKPSAVDFMDEWLNLAKSGTGERGIFNREVRIPKRRRRAEFGINPCQPGFAQVLTPDGIRTFDDIDIGSTVWSGQRWTKVTNKQYTGEKDVYEFHTRAGIFVGTGDHKVFSSGIRVRVDEAETIDTAWLTSTVETPTLCPIDIVDGLVVGDGTVHKASNDLVLLEIGKDDTSYFTDVDVSSLIGNKSGAGDHTYRVMTTVTADELPLTFKRTVPKRFVGGNTAKVCGFLRGLYSANGSVVGATGRVTLKASSFGIIATVQNMLSSIGIRSYYTVNKATDVAFKNGTFTCKQSYDLNITTDRVKFRDLIGFIQPHKMNKLNGFCSSVGESPLAHSQPKLSYDVVDAKYLGVYAVWDITVEADEHSYWTGGLLVSNCAEIVLRSQQFCNLSIVVARPDDTAISLHRKIRLATYLGTAQSTLTYFPNLDAKWGQNCEEERLLGVDITGQRDCAVLQQDEAATLFDDLREYAVKINKELSTRFGIKQSASVTCVKPSGNSAQLLGCSSGLHVRYAPFYIRRVRTGSSTPVARLLKDAGVPYHPETGQRVDTATVLVFEFPVKSPDGAICRRDVSAADQFNYWLLNKTHYTEHSASCTIYVDDDEWFSLGALVYANWDSVSGLSFLPKDNHTYPLAPYSEITESEYRNLSEKFPVLDWTKLPEYELEDETTQALDYACVGGSCEL